MGKMVSTAAVVLGAAFLLAAGCGGGDRLSKKELIAKADEICSEENRKLKAFGEAESMAEFARNGPQIVQIAEETNMRLKELEPPEELEDEYDELLDAADLNQEAAADASQAARDRARKTFDEQNALVGATFDQFTEVARKMEMEDCAEDYGL